MRVKQKRKKDPGTAVFYLVVTVLGLVLIGLSILFMTRINRTYDNYSSDANYLLYTVNRGDYIHAWLDVQNNRANGETEKKNAAYTLPYAIVDYFEAESYYTMYLNSGDMEKARQYREEMDSAYEKMGELQYIAEDIDALLSA